MSLLKAFPSEVNILALINRDSPQKKKPPLQSWEKVVSHQGHELPVKEINSEYPELLIEAILEMKGNKSFRIYFSIFTQTKVKNNLLLREIPAAIN